MRNELNDLQAYRRLRRGRLRMILEGIEDYCRGWHGKQLGLGGERITRGQYAIEHVMPRKWSIDLKSKTSLSKVRRDYIESLDVDIEDDDDDD